MQYKEALHIAMNHLSSCCRCQPIVDEAVAAPASASTIQLLDDISDHVCNAVAIKCIICLPQTAHQTCLLQLCQVYDSAEFCRNVHASTEWRQQALQAVMITASGLHQ